MFYVNFFFFSSRRRHTRWPRDWSSDVCSSDLLALQEAWRPGVEWPAAGLGAALFLLLAALAYPRGLGMGDVKLALLLGVATGRAVPVALFAGMVAALVSSVVLFARHGAAAR